MTADDVWNRHRALADLGGKLSAVWAPTGEEVRLTDAADPDDSLPPGPELDSRCGEEGGHPRPGRALVVRRGKRRRLLCARCADGRWVAFQKIFYGRRRAMTPLDFQNGLLSKVEDPAMLYFGDGREVGGGG